MKFLIVSSILFSLFLFSYWLLLRKSSYFKLNRFILVLLPLLSMAWVLFPSEINSSLVTITSLDEVIISAKAKVLNFSQLHRTESLSWFNLYLWGLGLSFCFFLFRVYRTLKEINNSAHSFFKRIYLPKEENKITRDVIQQHEQLHVLKWHSADVVMAELYALIFWFNPLNRWYIKHLKLNHEYEVDAEILREEPQYSKILLAKQFNVDPLVLGHSFNNSNLKNRLKMMKREKQKTTLLFLALFVGIVSFGLWSCSKEEIKEKVASPNTIMKTNHSDPNHNPEKGDNIVQPDKMPEFPGGKEAFINYMMENVVYPKSEEKSGTEGRVLVEFTISKDGSVSNALIKKGVNKHLDAAALEAVNNMPNWIPAELDGKKINYTMVLPVVFKLD